jgi:hypothetical protein
MKKYMRIFCLSMLIMLLTGCNNDGKDAKVSPTPEPTMPVEQETPSPTGIQEETENDPDDDNDELSIEDYYPVLKDTEYIYEGIGMEYASFTVYMDYYDEDEDRYQTRTDNGGTVTAKVIEVDDGKISVIKSVGEAYYRDNLLNVTADKNAEVLIMEPLKKGTNWTLPDGSERYISNMSVKVETDLGTYDTIEVTTEREDSLTKDYYAKDVGLVRSVFKSDDYEVSSTLSEINKNKPYSHVVEFFYPGKDEKIYIEQKALTFPTNSITRLVFEKAVKEEILKDNYLPLISTNTKINSMYLGKDNIVYVDFSKEFIDEMNAGSGYEQLILQCIVNTLGNYYGVQEVYITVDGKNYESGHILLKKGETMKVNMDSVVRED